MLEPSSQIPTNGYILKLWDSYGYRATALAYMQRENLCFVENLNGSTYSLAQIKAAIINHSN